MVTKDKKYCLGLFSGIHGDEQEIISSVNKVVNKIKTTYLFIPHCSPSAIKLKTRFNGDNIDLNRDFTLRPQSQEAKEIIKQLRPCRFSVCVDFHEDKELSGVYVYDSYNIEGSNILNKFRYQVQRICPLYSGVDDSSDKSLECQVQLGYYSYNPPQKDSSGKYKYEGFLDIWALIENVTKRWITLEVPSNLTQNEKDLIVEIFFNTFLNQYCK